MRGADLHEYLLRQFRLSEQAALRDEFDPALLSRYLQKSNEPTPFTKVSHSLMISFHWRFQLIS
jgi:hypothetical protein